MKKGSCLCGAVAFDVSGDLGSVTSCHCGMCRKTSGNFWAAFHVKTEQLTITKDEGLAWFRSSDYAERGFCNKCGASMFWRMDDRTRGISVAPGVIDGPTDSSTVRHIFLKDRGDWYDLAEGPDMLEKY